jgi:hypothetical protein
MGASSVVIGYGPGSFRNDVKNAHCYLTVVTRSPSTEQQSNPRHNGALRAPIFHRHTENIVVMLCEHDINSGNLCCSKVPWK